MSCTYLRLSQGKWKDSCSFSKQKLKGGYLAQWRRVTHGGYAIIMNWTWYIREPHVMKFIKLATLGRSHHENRGQRYSQQVFCSTTRGEMSWGTAEALTNWWGGQWHRALDIRKWWAAALDHDRCHQLLWEARTRRWVVEPWMMMMSNNIKS